MRITLLVLALLATGCSTKAPELIYEKPDVYIKTVPERVQHIIQFEFDSIVPVTDVNSVLAPHANYLIRHPSRKIFIDGLADEQGQYHYNYLLGMRRANAVKDALLEMGVDQNQIIVHSMGVERPYKPGVHEDNRRVILLY